MIKQDILLVEDEKGMRTGLEKVLKDQGYNVTAVSDYESGLKAGLERKDTWNLAIVDLALGDERDQIGFSGKRLNKELRKKKCKFPIIVYSGHTYLTRLDEELIEEGTSEDVDFKIVNKPDPSRYRLLQGDRRHSEDLRELHKDLLGKAADLTSKYIPLAKRKVHRGPIILDSYRSKVLVQGNQVEFSPYQYKYLCELMIAREPVGVYHFIEHVHEDTTLQLSDKTYRQRVQAHISYIRGNLREAGLKKAEDKDWPVLYDRVREGYKLPWEYRDKIYK